MKLFRFRKDGSIKPGILDQSGISRDASSIVNDWSGESISDNFISQLDQSKLSSLPEVSNIDYAPCVGDIGKFMCIGLNYSDHAKEVGMDPPEEPILFMKATSAISGPNDDVEIPKNSVKSDWEVELGVVIGKEAKYVSEQDAENYIAGYCVINDLSEREFQLEKGGQWVKGKSCDTFGPIGPYLVTRDEVKDPQNLNLWLELNGNKVQDGNTNTMIHKVFFTLSYLSQFMSLQPGDVISTGTPPGVGSGMNPPLYLKSGDSMRLGIEGLGEQSQKVV
ncbi:MAG: fumarylacetoacetate hydrolase family protein [Dehalococcoidia bacterium]|tara:strand:- start:1939 stop:2772 length:834 start_codon:yes stop_codon:yes gene_type:complete